MRGACPYSSAGSATGLIGSRVVQTHLEECRSVTGRARHACMNPSRKSGADAGIPLTRTFFGRAWVAGGSTPAFRVVESGSAQPAPSVTDSRPCVATFDDVAQSVERRDSLRWARRDAGSTPAVVMKSVRAKEQ